MQTNKMKLQNISQNNHTEDDSTIQHFIKYHQFIIFTILMTTRLPEIFKREMMITLCLRQLLMTQFQSSKIWTLFCCFHFPILYLENNDCVTCVFMVLFWNQRLMIWSEEFVPRGAKPWKQMLQSHYYHSLLKKGWNSYQNRP